MTPNLVILTTRRGPYCNLFFFQFPVPLPRVQCRPLCVWAAGDWGAAHVFLGQDDHSVHYEIKGGFTLAEKSDDIFDIWHH